MGGERFAGIQISHFGVWRDYAAFAHKAVDRLLPYFGDCEIMRDMELVGGGFEQPVADLAVLLRAMELRNQQRGRDQHQEQKPVFHGSLRATIFTGSRSSRSFKKLTRTRPSVSVETIAGDALPITSHPAGRTTTLPAIPNGRHKMRWPSSIH